MSPFGFSQDMVVLPYKDSLLLFSRYLQQLVMESIGKEFDLDGNRVCLICYFIMRGEKLIIQKISSQIANIKSICSILNGTYI